MIRRIVAGPYDFSWDALGLADGRYGIVLTARNALGIETTATVGVIVDRTLIGLSVEPRVLSPNGDGRLDTARFAFQLNGPAQVSLVVRRGTRTLGQVFAGQLEAGPQSIEWNGRFRRVVGEREYRADLRATSAVARWSFRRTSWRTRRWKHSHRPRSTSSVASTSW